jgi:putative endonuclease
MSTDLVRFIADLSSRWRSRFSPSRPEHLRLGSRGEKLACRFLRRSGYKVLYRNFRGRTGGEIDIVCRDKDTLVFVEVKTRTREDFGRPFEAVDRNKQKRISRGALAWLRLLDDPDILFRFDVVEVIIAKGTEPRLELLRNAFALSEPYIY